MTKEEITKHKEKLKSDLLYRKEHWDKINAEIFEKLKPFKTIDDIPDIPKVKEETYNKYIIYKKNNYESICFSWTRFTVCRYGQGPVR